MLKYLIFFLFLPGILCAQEAIPLGAWRTHFSYQHTHMLAIAKQKIYTAAGNGLFYYDQDDKSVNVLSKMDGLHEVGIATMAYHPQQEALLIAYRNGGIDVLTDTQIFAYDLLKSTSATAIEQINHIFFSHDTVFMATSAGVRVFTLDVDMDEPISILESYTKLSENGATDLPVYGSALLRDSIFIGTAKGILSASLHPGVNRQDFDNWYRFGTLDGLPSVPIRHIAVSDGYLFAAVDKEGIYRYENGKWIPTPFTTTGNFSSFNPFGQGLLIVADGKIFTYQDVVMEIGSALAQNPVFAQVDQQNVLWVADSVNGLVKISGAQEESFFPSGPPTDDTWEVTSAEDKIIGVAGGYTNNFFPAGIHTGFYTFNEGIWQDHSDKTQLIPIADLVDVVYNAVDKQFYFASFSDGIGVWPGETEVTLIDNNTPGSTLVTRSATEPLLSIAALDTDEEGRLWIANYGVDTPLHLWNPQNNNWRAYSFSQVAAQFPLNILVAVSGEKWLLLENGDILVYNHETGEERYLGNATGEGGLPGTRATTIVSDQDGLIWVGTDQGVAFFPDPFSIFSGTVDAIRPIFDRRPLLRDQLITSMTVDGGNRKWVGTPNGIWLFDETGESLVHNFTTENSPLPSNYIQDIAVDAVSGEVFIATDKGMVSYRGTATAGGETHQAVKIFPNPVSMSFNGTVGISGLVDDAIVKITTVTGTLVQEVRAEGGTATWNITDYRGERVATGVYLVFSASLGGNETFVGKIAVVN